MTREEVIAKLSEKMRLIRTEAGYTQDKMSEVIGLSKKTLVQIEKGRMEANWQTVVTICALFRESETIQYILGNEPLEVLETIARDGIDYRKEKTLGGKLWWRELERKGPFILQQNVISQHYRILDDEYFRLFSSLEEAAARERFMELVNESVGS